MKLHDLQRIYDSLNEEKFEINIKPLIMKKAGIPIQRMFESST
jgi:quinolinate synthase